jgi:hypothetical protein
MESFHGKREKTVTGREHGFSVLVVACIMEI